MRKTLTCIALGVLTPLLVCAQDRFEVASVRISAPRTAADILMGGFAGGPGTDSPQRISWRATALGALIQMAYSVQPSQIVAPGWVNVPESEYGRYDIAATMPPGTTKEQMSRMIRTLLEERFGLRFHRETQQQPSYTLSVAKGGPKLKPTTADSGPPLLMFGGRPEGGMQIRSRRSPLANIIKMLEAMFRQEAVPVVDATGLPGDYDFEIHYADPALNAPDSGLPSIFTALEQDLGLLLEKRKGPVEMFIVESVNKVPTEN